MLSHKASTFLLPQLWLPGHGGEDEEQQLWCDTKQQQELLDTFYGP